MVIISETSGGSNGGDPNKKRKDEEENRRNKKLKGKLSYSLPIPYDLTLSCFALVRRCHYQKLSLVCSNFRDIIRSRDQINSEQTWSGLEFPNLPDTYKEFGKYAVMEKKIYLMDGVLCCAFDPINMRWFHQGLGLDYLRPVWHMSYCVVDDLLVCINPTLPLVGGPIALYELKQDMLRHVNGLQGFPGNMNLSESRMENFDGNLVILGSDQSWFSEYKGKKEIWCVEISFEIRGIGEIWGNVESAAVVLTTFNNTPSIQLCRTVTL
ncbi:PREDICTED: putative F-box/kelch-repeat protein At2g21680 [Camelina sativa]|uniref:F-box/kelch-repeat protein At2g21680 n=1 Tax=Camelina sativa TaxID=90675 RepID=A0ABM0WPV9_CAMSA|nr:PREDICTED: putative F-box/kelch-repeat protein At2g21680 [Camelina sativa]